MTAPPPSYPQFAPPPASSGSGVWITVLILLVAMGVGGGLYLYYHGPGTNAAEPSTTTAAPAQPTDSSILADIRRTLASSESTRNATFDVKVENGVATLTGKTNRRTEADMAESLTAGVTGVKQVKNEIEVEKPPEATTQASAPPEEPPARPKPNPEDVGRKRRALMLVKQGQAQVDSGDYSAAVDTFEQAVALDPNNALAQAGLRKAQKAKQTEEDIMKRRR